MQEQEQVELRSTPGREEAEEWHLVLTAEGLSPQLDRAAGAFVISVPMSQIARASAVLSEYDIEQLPRREVPGLAEETDSPWGITVSLGITAGLLCFFVVTGERSLGTAWFVAGSADAGRILSGELWRCVTALTLHADVPHVLGNALFGALFIGATLRVLGPGLGGLLVLTSGIAGNLANAFFHGSAHSSVGASTAIFGAVGLLGGLGVMRRLSRDGSGLRAWAPAGAGLALLAMIGTGGRADLWAHLLGLCAGWPLGAGAAKLLPTRPGPAGQWLLGGIALALVSGAWELALH